MSIELKPLRYAHSDGHTDVCYSTDGKKLITCGTDGDIRIWSGFDDDDPVQTCVGEWSHCVRQKNNLVYVATDSNNVQLVTYPEGERDRILVRFTAHVNHIAVGKDHDMVAIAAEDWEVKVITVVNNETVSHSFEGLMGPPLSVALCPKAKLLAVTSGDGHLRTWDVATQKLLKEINCVPKVNSFKNATLLARIDFDPISGDDLAYPDKNSIVILNTHDWSVKVTLKSDALSGFYSILQYSPCGEYIAGVAEKGEIILWQVKTQTLFGITKHPREVPICALVWNPEGNGEIAFCDAQGQLGMAIISKSEESQEISEKEETQENEVDFDGYKFTGESDDEDNENVVSLEKLKKDIMGPSDTEIESESEAVPTPRPRTPEVPLQNPFMPSSTPEHLNPRYLCWNHVGIVRSYGNFCDDEDDDGSRSIEVEFHDSTFHSSMMMQNYQGYTMGSLSTTSLIVANNSQISVIPLNSSSHKWILNVEENESIICITNSDKLIYFATSNYLVRVCTTYGTQKAIFSVPGPLVSMSAYGYYVLIAYHNASPRKDDQCISMILVKLDGVTVESKNIESALGPESILRWLGFTDLGTPASQDSLGMLCLFPLQSNIWIPFCDTSKQCKSPADGFFVTAILESSQTIHGIRCRGSVYPSFTPRPTLCEIPLQPPFSELGTEKSQLESCLFTLSMLKNTNTAKKFKEAGLKTFVLACKNNLDQRALELIEMLGNQQLLSLAIKYAMKFDRKRLGEKLMELASVNNVDDSFNDSLQSFSTPTDPKSLRRKLVLNSASKSTSKVNIPNNSVSNVDAPSQQSNSRNISTADSSLLNSSVVDTTINSQNSFTEAPRNPFLKSLKNQKTPAHNPLSLTDENAGINVEEKTTNESKSNEKRKQPDSDTDKQKEKQRRLDKFMCKRT